MVYRYSHSRQSSSEYHYSSRQNHSQRTHPRDDHDDDLDNAKQKIDFAQHELDSLKAKLAGLQRKQDAEKQAILEAERRIKQLDGIVKEVYNETDRWRSYSDGWKNTEKSLREKHEQDVKDRRQRDARAREEIETEARLSEAWKARKEWEIETRWERVGIKERTRSGHWFFG